MVTCEGRRHHTTARNGMAWNAALQATCRVAQRLKRPAGIALHRMARPISRRFTPHASLLTPHASSGKFCCTSTSAALFLTREPAPVGKMGEKERRRKWHEGGITGETEELTISTISTICTTVYITTHYGTLCLRAHDGCPRWCRPLLGAIMLVNQASRQGSKEARKQARRALPCDSRPQALPITQCLF